MVKFGEGKEDSSVEVRSVACGLFSDSVELQAPWRNQKVKFTINPDDLMLQQKFTFQPRCDPNNIILRQLDQTIILKENNSAVPDSLKRGIPFEISFLKKRQGWSLEKSCGTHCLPVPFMTGQAQWKLMWGNSCDVNLDSFYKDYTEWEDDFDRSDYHQMFLSSAGYFVFRAQSDTCKMSGTFDISHAKRDKKFTIEIRPTTTKTKLTFSSEDPQLSAPQPLRSKDLLNLISRWIRNSQRREVRTVCKLWANAIQLFPAKFRLHYRENVSQNLFNLANYAFGIETVGNYYHPSDEESEKDEPEHLKELVDTDKKRKESPLSEMGSTNKEMEQENADSLRAKKPKIEEAKYPM